MTGWWYTYPSENYEFVSWDDDIPNIWEKEKMFQTTNQINKCQNNVTLQNPSDQGVKYYL